MRNLETNENLKEIIKEGIWVVDFYAEWCGPCKMLLPVLDSMKEQNIIKVNVDFHNDLATSYGVMTVPTLIFFKDGIEINKTTGFKSKQMILDIIDKM